MVFITILTGFAGILQLLRKGVVPDVAKRRNNNYFFFFFFLKHLMTN